MAEKDPAGPDEKSLELPSLFGRKKKAKAEPAPEVTSEATPAATPEESSSAPEPEPQPAEETAVVEPVRAPVAEPTQTLPSVDAPEPAPVREEQPTPTPVATETAPEPGGARKARSARQAPSLPALGSAVAALVVGALVGLLGVGLTYVSLQACDAITGTDSCGGPGLILVLAVVVVMIVVGNVLLRAFGVSEPGGLSFLGVAIFVAICLVFLVEQLLEPWMIVVGPVLCALGYGTAHWVVNRFNTELLAEEGPEAHDIR